MSLAIIVPVLVVFLPVLILLGLAMRAASVTPCDQRVGRPDPSDEGLAWGWTRDALTHDRGSRPVPGVDTTTTVRPLASLHGRDTGR